MPQITRSHVNAAGIGAATGAVLLAAAQFITPWEGVFTKPYFDLVHVKTVCIGQTAADGIDLNRTYTVKECQDMLAKTLPKYNDGIKKCLHPAKPISFNMEVAFTSAAYNIGVPGFCGSTMARRVNAGDFKGACDALLLWNKAGGRVVKGLDNRRRAERELCLKGL